jgi:putative ABC transport system permease protein
MLKATWRSLNEHKARMLLSGLAVVLGVAFVVGTFIFTDTLKGTFDQLFSTEAPDVVVTKELRGLGDQGTGSVVSVVPQSVVNTIGDLRDTERVTGDVQVLGVAVLDTNGEPIGGQGPPQLGGSFPEFPDDPKLSQVTIVEGRSPTAPKELVLDEQTAERGGLQVGDTVTVVTQGPRLQAPLVGIARFGTTGSLAGATLALFERDYAQQIFIGSDGWTQVSAVGTFGVSPERLRDEVIAAVGPGYAVLTGKEAQDRSAEQFAQALGFINTFLLVFAFIALFVGLFIILNTFSMLVARRTRELALLRAIGASKAQITWSVVGEALILGVVGGALGVALGIGVAAGLRGLLAAIGIDLPAGDLVIEPRTVIVGLVAGVIATLIGAYFPARRASRVPPVAAMRDDVALPARGLRVRAVLGTLFVVLGGGLLGWTVSNVDVPERLSLAGLGAATLLVGVIVLAPVFSRAVVGVVGAPVAQSGTVGRLAVRNAQRDRRRTAATATAILIGLTLVTTIGVLGSSATKSIDSIIDDVISADIIVTPTSFVPFSTEVGNEIAAIPGVQTVSRVRQAPAIINGDQTVVTGVDPTTIDEAITLGGGVAGLRTGEVVVDAETAATKGLSVGETLDVNWGTSQQELHLTGLYEGSGAFAGFVVSLDTLTAAGLPTIDTALYVVLDPAADQDAVAGALDGIEKEFPIIKVQDQTELKESISGQIGQLLNLVYGLLALSVVIAIVGVINTLALSVLERTRELGLLRAVGTLRRQIRAMIRWESMVISFFGAVTGVGLGLVLGIALQRLLADQGITALGIPWPLILIVMVATAIIGVLAALWPARRAARLDILQAIRTE